MSLSRPRNVPAYTRGAKGAFGLPLFYSIKQVKKLVHALSHTFYHKISRWLYRISHQVQALYRRFRSNIFSLCDTIDRPLTTVGTHNEDARVLLK